MRTLGQCPNNRHQLVQDRDQFSCCLEIYEKRIYGFSQMQKELIKVYTTKTGNAAPCRCTRNPDYSKITQQLNGFSDAMTWTHLFQGFLGGVLPGAGVPTVGAVGM